MGDALTFTAIAEMNTRQFRDELSRAKRLARDGCLVRVVDAGGPGFISVYLIGADQLPDGVDGVLDLLRQGTGRTLACPTCSEEKPWADFTRDPSKPSGSRAECKTCEYKRRGRSYVPPRQIAAQDAS